MSNTFLNGYLLKCNRTMLTVPIIFGSLKCFIGESGNLLRFFCSSVFSQSLPRPDPQSQSDTDSIIKCKSYQFLNSLKPLPYQGQEKWQSGFLAGLALGSHLPPGPGKNPAVTSILVNF